MADPVREPPPDPPLQHLRQLEAESIHIIREVVAECERPVMYTFSMRIPGTLAPPPILLNAFSCARISSGVMLFQSIPRLRDCASMN